ncbi:ABC transporter substrate-binding protein [Skermanella stibiiresistens SB22]|uniref:ABC transporter substrate-binding protein n=1 Tax=Skermanella stibiiresistens SB22 TaxID=1385369 RepID=W9H494_9PROT|nr:DUF2076 domain-containing protein [Skermanella stibiiresistens]EWY41035.1 ABC transporter substrate-binding protein [Skermanella stibiiresistens SB22]
MTPREKELITSLLDRLARTGGDPKDPEAEALIRQALAAQPDAPYRLVQTVLIQDMALNQAQSRIADLETRLATANSRPQPRTSFLGDRAAGPWGQAANQPGAQTGGYARPDYAPPPYGGYQPQPQLQAQPQAQFGAAPSFLRSAATTAAGVAGGALLFEGIRSMFGHHADGILSGIPDQPAISETVINNYYPDDDPAAPVDHGADDTDASYDPSYDDGGPDFTPDDGGFDSGDSV